MQAGNFMQRTMQLEKLIGYLETSIEPPISAIENALLEYLSFRALPAKKATPNGTDEHAFRLAILTLSVITCCRDHFKTRTLAS